MLRILLILFLSVSLLFSCGNPFSKKDEVDLKGQNVLVRGKVKEGGCKKFDLYCKRTGKVLSTKQMQDAPLAIIDKRRSGHNVAESLTVIGEDSGKTAILIDDMIDTGGTICAGAELLRKEGAKGVIACASHAVFSPPAITRLSAEGLFEEVVVTNSIPIPRNHCFEQLKVLSVANMLGEAIWRIHEESSISSMFR